MSPLLRRQQGRGKLLKMPGQRPSSMQVEKVERAKESAKEEAGAKELEGSRWLRALAKIRSVATQNLRP